MNEISSNCIESHQSNSNIFDSEIPHFFRCEVTPRGVINLTFFSLKNRGIFETNYVKGFALLIDVKVIKKIGMFDKNILLHYYKVSYNINIF